jgi:N-acetylmuramoyl-L-alanine amidase
VTLFGLAVRLAGQAQSTGLSLLTRDGRRAVPTAMVGGQEMIALDELSSIFQLTVREEAGAITLSYRGRTIVVTPDQTIASVAGRVISLPAPPGRVGNRWYVPLDFITRAIAPVYDSRVELRRPARLLLVGDVRVPRVAIRHESLGNAARITVEITPRANPTVSQDGASRLTVRIDADAIDAALPQGQIAGFIDGYRMLDATAVSVDLGARFTGYRATTQTLDTETRLTIDVLAGAAEPATPPAPAAPQTTQGEATLPELPNFGGGGRIRTVAIDAGHGGDDGGAKGAGGTMEKAITLSVARRVRAVIEARLGLRVVMTRDDDRRVPVTDRTSIANNNKADVFISLHANASFRPSVSGAAIYVASFDEANAPPRSDAPERLPAIGGGIRDLQLVQWNLAQMRFVDQSDAFANILAEQFNTRVPLAARSVDHAPLRVLESANMPAVLVEIGYLTNADQEKLLGNGDFQGVVAQSIVDAIVRFRDVGMQSEGAVR